MKSSTKFKLCCVLLLLVLTATTSVRDSFLILIHTLPLNLIPGFTQILKDADAAARGLPL